MRQTIKRAGELGDYGTVGRLEEVLKDREDLGYHLYSILEDDSLVRGMTHLLDNRNDMKGDHSVNSNNKLQ